MTLNCKLKFRFTSSFIRTVLRSILFTNFVFYNLYAYAAQKCPDGSWIEVAGSSCSSSSNKYSNSNNSKTQSNSTQVALGAIQSAIGIWAEQSARQAEIREQQQKVEQAKYQASQEKYQAQELEYKKIYNQYLDQEKNSIATNPWSQDSDRQKSNPKKIPADRDIGHCLQQNFSMHSNGKFSLKNICNYPINLKYTFSTSKQFSGAYTTLQPTQSTFETANQNEQFKYNMCPVPQTPQTLDGGCI